MGIYLSNMEMPKNCRECFACKAELSQEKKVIYVCCFAMADCPLVHVPEHGRLIDADALMLKIKDYIEEYDDLDENGYYNLKWCAMKEAEMAIEDAPTIIPAEEGE